MWLKIYRVVVALVAFGEHLEVTECHKQYNMRLVQRYNPRNNKQSPYETLVSNNEPFFHLQFPQPHMSHLQT